MVDKDLIKKRIRISSAIDNLEVPQSRMMGMEEYFAIREMSDDRVELVWNAYRYGYIQALNNAKAPTE